MSRNDEVIFEAIPNVAEGRDVDLICKLSSAFKRDGVALLHLDSGGDANRTVFSICGFEKPLEEALVELYRKAAELINMKNYMGNHPTTGAVDVCPIVPLGEGKIADARNLSDRLAKRVHEEIGIPIVLYGESATNGKNEKLSHIRKGGYKAFRKRIFTGELIADFPDKGGGKKSGLSSIGARNLMLAWNINLSTKDIEIAKHIANQVRESAARGFHGCRAIGWYMSSIARTQVSLNLYDLQRVNVYDVFKRLEKLARKNLVLVTGSELIGLIPFCVFSGVISKLGIMDDNAEKQLNDAIKFLGLDELKPFIANERILEKCMMNAGFTPDKVSYQV